MSVLTLLVALFAWLLGPFAPLVPFAQVGIVAVAGAFWVYESDATSEVRAIEEPASTANEPLCFGEEATINARGRFTEGTDGDDVIVGRRGRDFIDAGPGNDLVCGGGGNDQLYGGDGDDRLDGGPGNDWLYDRENDQDDLHGGPGRDRCEILSRSISGCEHTVIFD